MERGSEERLTAGGVEEAEEEEAEACWRGETDGVRQLQAHHLSRHAHPSSMPTWT